MTAAPLNRPLPLVLLTAPSLRSDAFQERVTFGDPVKGAAPARSRPLSPFVKGSAPLHGLTAKFRVGIKSQSFFNMENIINDGTAILYPLGDHQVRTY